MTQARFDDEEPALQVTAHVVERSRALYSEELVDEVSLVAKQCVMDWFAVALAAWDEPLVRILSEQASEDGSIPVATVLMRGRKFSARQAALLNGAMGHAIDYDDVNISGQGHITAAVLPAALAASETERLGGKSLLRAFVSGYEAAVMIGRFVGREHYLRGFHATATVGSYGAAITSSLLFGLDAEMMARAVGIAGTQAAGLKAQFGTMCKPFHAGKANENGLLGALLARRGFTSRRDILECEQGFASTQGRCGAPEEASIAAPRGAHIMDSLFKFSAACYGTHGGIAAAAALRRMHEINPCDIQSVEVRVESGADRMCNIAAPSSGLEAKFSLRFNVALALLGENTSSPELYSDGITTRADVCALRDRISVRCMPEGWSLTRTDVSINLSDGRRLEASHDTGLPTQDIEEQGERITEKFMTLVNPVLGSARAAELAAMIGDVENLRDVDQLLALVR